MRAPSTSIGESTLTIARGYDDHRRDQDVHGDSTNPRQSDGHDDKLRYDHGHGCGRGHSQFMERTSARAGNCGHGHIMMTVHPN